MDYKKVLSAAAENKRSVNSATIKRYTTDYTTAPAKKPAQKNAVQSDAVKAYLDRKKREEEIKSRQAELKRQELLELRSIARNNKKANAMAKRTKDNNFMSGFSNTADLARSQSNFESSGTHRSKVSQPWTSVSVKPKDRCHDLDDDRRTQVRNGGHETDLSPDKKRQTSLRKQPPPDANFNFNDLLKVASKKQHEPIRLPKIPKKSNVVEDQGRLMTVEQKRRYMEEQARKNGKSLADIALPKKTRKKFDPTEPDKDILVKPPSVNQQPKQSKDTLKYQKTPLAKARNVQQMNRCGSDQDKPPREGPKQLSRETGFSGKTCNSVNKSNKRLTVQDDGRIQKPLPSVKKTLPTDARITYDGNNSRSSVSLKRKTDSVEAPSKYQKLEGKRQQNVTMLRQNENRPNSSGCHGVSKPSPSLVKKPQLIQKTTTREGRSMSSIANGKQSTTTKPRIPPLASSKGPPLPASISSLPSATRNYLPERPLSEKPISRQSVPQKLPPKNPQLQNVRREQLSRQQAVNRDNMPTRQFPPRDLMTRQIPQRSLPNRPLQGPPRRRIESDSEEEEYDEEMDDFIDDGPIEGDDLDYSKHIKEIFGYDRSKYRYEKDECMESSYLQQMKEEAISAKLGILEDLEDIRREEDEMKRQLTRCKKPKK